MQYYSPTQALSYNTPFIFSMGSRSIGKTFGWTDYAVRRFLKKKRKFMYMRRYDEDLKLTAPGLFNNVCHNHQDVIMQVDGNGKSATPLKIGGELAGMTVALSKAYKYKSVNLSDYDTIFFDEFLPEDGKYLSDEVGMVLNFYQTVARGYNQPIRPEVKFVFVANNVTLNNPYFRELKIREKIVLGQRYLVDSDRAWVVEMTDNKEITNEILTTPFGKMIAKTRYGDYALHAQFYLDDDTFIQKPTGKSTYICTLVYKDKMYGVYEYEEMGVYYVSTKAMKNSKTVFAITTKDHSPNYLLLYRNRLNPIFTLLKFAYENALLRFDCGESKFMFLEFMSLSQWLK